MSCFLNVTEWNTLILCQWQKTDPGYQGGMGWAEERIHDLRFLELFLDVSPFLNETSLCYLSKLPWRSWIQSDCWASDHTWQHQLRDHEGGLTPGLSTQSTERCHLLLDTDELIDVLDEQRYLELTVKPLRPRAKLNYYFRCAWEPNSWQHHAGRSLWGPVSLFCLTNECVHSAWMRVNSVSRSPMDFPWECPCVCMYQWLRWLCLSLGGTSRSAST